jgi:calcineurin-like phosphoesterase family protein
MAIFFISDTHFGHANIIKTCKRPFDGVAEMDDAMVLRWNECVRRGDTVYHLGDFCYRNSRSADTYARELNGEIHLIAGNHDEETIARCPSLFASISHIREIHERGHRIVMCHYPMREWHGSWDGGWHLFGHVHGRLDHEPHGYSLDVGADAHDFRPWSMDEIERTFASRDNPFCGKRRPLRTLAPSGAG